MLRFIRGGWKWLRSGDAPQRSGKLAIVLLPVFVIVLALMFALAPAPSPETAADTTSASEFMSSIDAATSTQPAPTSSPTPTSNPVRPVKLKDIRQEEACGAGFCAAFPTAGQLPDAHTPVDSDWITVDLSIDDHKGEVCQGLVDEMKAQCPGATALETYSVMTQPAPGRSPEAARDAAWSRRDLRTCDHFQKDIVAGKPAIRSIFHTKEGGFGPYVDIFDGTRVFHVWASGQPADETKHQSTGARFGPDFVKSFRFTAP